MLANRLVIGAEADVTVPAYPNPVTGLGIGGATALSPLSGAETYSDNVLASGTARARIGYAPSNWLYYATGGLAWSAEEFKLTQAASGTTESEYRARLGWAASAGIEGPVAPHWTARLEYLYTGYGYSSVTFPRVGSGLIPIFRSKSCAWA